MVSILFKLSIISFSMFTFLGIGFLIIIVAKTIVMDHKSTNRSINVHLAFYFLILLAILCFNVYGLSYLSSAYKSSQVQILSISDIEKIWTLFVTPLLSWLFFSLYIFFSQSFGYSGISFFKIDDKIFTTFGEEIKKEDCVHISHYNKKVVIFLKQGSIRVRKHNKFLLKYFENETQTSYSDILYYASYIYKKPIDNNEKKEIKLKPRFKSVYTFGLIKYMLTFLSILFLILFILNSQLSKYSFIGKFIIFNDRYLSVEINKDSIVYIAFVLFMITTIFVLLISFAELVLLFKDKSKSSVITNNIISLIIYIVIFIINILFIIGGFNFIDTYNNASSIDLSKLGVLFKNLFIFQNTLGFGILYICMAVFILIDLGMQSLSIKSMVKLLKNSIKKQKNSKLFIIK